MIYKIMLRSPWKELALLESNIGLHKGSFCYIEDKDYEVMYLIYNHDKKEMNIVVKLA